MSNNTTLSVKLISGGNLGYPTMVVPYIYVNLWTKSGTVSHGQITSKNALITDANWNESFSIPIQGKEDKLCIQVYGYTFEREYGRAEIPLDDLQKNVESKKQVQVSEKGTITLSLSLA